MKTTLNLNLKYENNYTYAYKDDDLIASNDTSKNCLRLPFLLERINKLSEEQCNAIVVHALKNGDIIEPVAVNKEISVETYLLENSFIHYKTQTDEYPL